MVSNQPRNNKISPKNGNKQLIWVIVGAVIVVAVGLFLFYSQQNDKFFWQADEKLGQKTITKTTKSGVSTKPTQQTTESKPSPTPPKPTEKPAPTATAPGQDITSYTDANLFMKCISGNVDNQDLWADSPASVAYADFNSDGVKDALSYGTPPGTAKVAEGCVYTIKGYGPALLWKIPDSLAQSSISVNGSNQIIYTGYPHPSDAENPVTYTYTWSSAQGTFVNQ